MDMREQNLTRPYVAEHNLSQDASRIPEVRSQIVGDCGLSLVEWRDGRLALQDAFPTPLADRFAQRKLPPESNLTFDVGLIRRRWSLLRVTHGIS